MRPFGNETGRANVSPPWETYGGRFAVSIQVIFDFCVASPMRADLGAALGSDRLSGL